MQYFHFERLVNKYSTDFMAVTLSAGYYDDMGDWVEAETVITPMTGAIIGRSESKIFRSEGALTEKDKRLFVLEPIDDKLHGATIVYKKDAYTLLNCVENANFTGVYAYNLKYVSAFKDIAPDYNITEDLEELEQRLDGILVKSIDPPPAPDDTGNRLEQRLDGVLID